jgi:type III secretion system FlhB-like substrate exporter
MKHKFDNYERFAYSEAGKATTDNIKKAVEDEVKIENDSETLKELITMDLRDNIPPQIYEVISCVVDVVQKVDKEGNN